MSQSEQENQCQGQASTIENPSSISTEKNKRLLSTKMKKKKIPRNSSYHVWSNKNNNYNNNNNSQLFRKYPPSFRKATYRQSVLGPAPWQSKTDDCHTHVFFTKKMIKNFQIVSEVLCFFYFETYRISFTFNFPNI